MHKQRVARLTDFEISKTVDLYITLLKMATMLRCSDTAAAKKLSRVRAIQKQYKYNVHN